MWFTKRYFSLVNLLFLVDFNFLLLFDVLEFLTLTADILLIIIGFVFFVQNIYINIYFILKIKIILDIYKERKEKYKYIFKNQNVLSYCGWNPW